MANGLEKTRPLVDFKQNVCSMLVSVDSPNDTTTAEGDRNAFSFFLGKLSDSSGASKHTKPFLKNAELHLTAVKQLRKVLATFRNRCIP